MVIFVKFISFAICIWLLPKIFFSSKFYIIYCTSFYQWVCLFESLILINYLIYNRERLRFCTLIRNFCQCRIECCWSVTFKVKLGVLHFFFLYKKFHPLHNQRHYYKTELITIKCGSLICVGSIERP